MSKVNLFLFLILSISLISSVVIPQWVEAASKNEKTVDKNLRKFTDEKKDKDLCTVTATKENNGDPLETATLFNNTNDAQCFPVAPVPINFPPIINIVTPITGVINQTIVVNASVSDPDGNVTDLIWNQESGIQVNFTAIEQILVFTPLANDTYVFSLEAQDNSNATSMKVVTIYVGTEPPVQTECGPNEVWDGNTCVCKEGYHEDESESCVPDVVVPTNETKKIVFVGDADGNVGVSVYNAVVKENADYVIVNGDLFYGDWDKFISTYGQLGNIVGCTIGNHEYSDNSIDDALPYCGNDWAIREGFNGVLLLGFNMNRDLGQQLVSAQGLLSDEQYMQGIHTVIINSHQPCYINDNAHHPVDEDGNEVPNFCNALDAAVPEGVHQIYVAGHEHNMQEGITDGNKWFISGAGGADHYDCGTGAIMCDDSHYGYLRMEIEPDGDITTQFVDYNGGVVN